MVYKVCSSCGKHIRDSELRCWNCQSAEFLAAETPAPVPTPLTGFMDKVKKHVATVKERHDEHKQTAADEKRREQQAEAERQRQLSTERKVAFEQAKKTCPLPLIAEKMRVAGGLELFNDEFVASIAKEWGWSTQKLTLTTHRVLWSRDFISTNQMSLYLTDIRDVKYRKPLIGFGTIVLETAAGRSVEGLPAASNGDMVRDRLMTLIHWARQRGVQQSAPALTESVAPQPPDRLDQLRRLGELKAQGVLSDEEFQAEKAKLLSQTN